MAGLFQKRKYCGQKKHEITCAARSKKILEIPHRKTTRELILNLELTLNYNLTRKLPT